MSNNYRINENDLFIKYKSSYISAFVDLSQNLVLLCFGNYMLYLFDWRIILFYS